MLTRPIALLVTIASLALAAPPARGQTPATRLTLDDAVTLATRANATLRAKALELRATRANEITASLRPNPTASYLAEQFGSSTGETQHTISLGQTFELGGKRQRRVESARAASRVTEFEVADVRRQVVYQVKKAFNDILVGEATLALAQENLKTLDEVERLQRIRAEKGDISELELNRIQVQRFSFERDAADARLAIANAKTALRAAVGPDVVAPDFTPVGQLEYGEVALDRAELYRRAIANRPDVRAADAARLRADADYRLARANAWWDITPQVEYQRIGPDNTVGFGFSLPLRVFDRNQGEIARTRAEIDRAGALREAAGVAVLADVDTALSQATSSREKLARLRDVYLPKAEKVRDTVEFAYRRGGLSLLDFLDAQRTYRETSLEHVRALGDYASALYQLEAAVGGALEQRP